MSCFDFLVWHVSGAGLFIIITRIIWCLVGIFTIYPHHLGSHLQIIKFAFNPIGKAMVYNHEGFPADPAPIMNIIRIPLVIGLAIPITLACFAIQIIGLILSCGRVNQYWESYWRVHELKSRLKIVSLHCAPTGQGQYNPDIQCKIAIRGHHGKYLCADNSHKMVCDRAVPQAWEHFISIPVSKNKIGLKTHHGKHVSAQTNGTLEGNRDSLREYEHFTVEKSGNKWGFKSHHGKWLSAQADGRIEINRDRFLAWEKFDIIVIENQGQSSDVTLNITPCHDTLIDGTYRFVAVHSNLSLDVEGASKAAKGKIIQHNPHNGENQMFKIRKQNNNYYTVQCLHSGHYWDIEGASQKGGTRLIQWPYHGKDNQLFKFENRGDNKWAIKAKHSNKLLDIEGGRKNNGAGVIQWDAHYGGNQLFYIVQDEKEEVIPTAPTMSIVDAEQPGSIPPPAYADIAEGEGVTGSNVITVNNGYDSMDVIGKWLNSIGDVFYSDYYQLFNDAGFDSIDVVKTLTQHELETVIGIQKVGHRRKLMIEIAKL